MGAITESDLLTNPRGRNIGYPYPCFTKGPEPVLWPLVGTVSVSESRMYYYERYANTDYIGLWSGKDDDRLLYPGSPLAYALGLADDDLYVVEEGYLFKIPIAYKANSDNMSITTKNGNPKLVADNNNFCTVPEKGAFGNMNFMAFGQNSNPDIFMDNENLVYYSIKLKDGQLFYGWFNVLYAKAIFPATTTGDEGYKNYPNTSVFNGTYSIRSPRQFENISKNLNGSFIQEININMDTVKDDEKSQETISAKVQTARGVDANGNRDPNNVNSNRYKKIYYTAQNGNKWVINVKPLEYDNPNTQAVITGTFNGTYSASYDHGYGTYISSIYNLNMGKNINNSNVSIFQKIGTGGTVSNLILYKNKISNTTTGNVGGLTAVNDGLIENVFISECSVNATNGNAGGIATVNNGRINNVVFVSSSATAPVSAATSLNAGGVVQKNNGQVNNVLYIAHAPKNSSAIFPIVHTQTASGSVGGTFYLYGTHNSSGIQEFNTASSQIGEPKTTQELNALTPWVNWRQSVEISKNTLTSSTFPYIYPTGGIMDPEQWSKATVPAIALAYFEVYEDETYGFDYTGTQYPLNDNKNIIRTGYCAIVPKSGKYSVKSSTNMSNTLVDSKSYQVTGMPEVFYVELPSSIRSNSNVAIEVYINDLQVTDPNSRFINTLFASATFGSRAQTEYTIRTPQQMQNINLIDTSGITFNQELDLNFMSIRLTSSVITAEFKGTFNGNDHVINNVTIDSTGDNVGLFSKNGGIIKSCILKPSISIKGRNNIGGIAGHNLETGSIIGCSVEVEEDIDNMGSYIGSIHIEGSDSVGGIAGYSHENNLVNCIIEGNEDIKNPSSVVGIHIKGSNNVGGIVGQNDGHIESCSIKNTTQQ